MNPAQQIKKLGTVFFVGAHPDDETFTSGGLLFTAINNGQKVVCVTATKGTAGIQDQSKWPAEKLAHIRERELEDSLKILGVKEHHWLGYQDGECQEVNEDQAVSKITDLITKYQPDTLISFGSDGMTGHSDHIAVGEWTKQAAASSKKPITVLQIAQTKDHYQKYLKEMDQKLNIFFKLEKPFLVEASDCTLDYHLPKEVAIKKVQALKALPSQTSKMFEKFDQDYLYGAFGRESFTAI